MSLNCNKKNLTRAQKYFLELKKTTVIWDKKLRKSEYFNNRTVSENLKIE